MQGSYFYYGLLASLAIALLIAAFTDFRRRQIDNWLNAAVALTAPLFWWASGLSLIDIGWQLAVALGSLVVLAGFFAMRWMGGGDVKLLTALALWLPLTRFFEMIVIMALLGGVLTLVIGSWHIARRQRDRVNIPYGLAISAAGLWVLAGHYFQPLHQSFGAG